MGGVQSLLDFIRSQMIDPQDFVPRGEPFDYAGAAGAGGAEGGRLSQGDSRPHGWGTGGPDLLVREVRVIRRRPGPGLVAVCSIRGSTWLIVMLPAD